jgi:PKD repeat protein
VKNVLLIWLVFFIGLVAEESSAQSILDSCYATAIPGTTFTGTASLSNAYDADLLEWTGAAWTGAWPNANVTTPPPCNVPPVRALWIGDSAVWTSGGEAFGLRFTPPLAAGNTYAFFFTYVSAGSGSNGAFAPSVYTNTNGLSTGNYTGDFIPAGFAWETHPFIFTATAAQAGDDYLIVHSFDGSGMVLSLCAETLTDLGDDSLTICVGDSAILFAGNGFQTYSWSTGATTQQITVFSAGTYVSTNQGFCGTSADTIVITLDPCGMFPVAVFSTTDNHICPGTCTDFVNLSQNAISYLWTFPGATPATSTDENPSSICYAAPGTYDVQLIATNAVTSDTLTLNSFITVYPYPAPQGILQAGDTLFANQGSASYQWYHDGVLIPGATDYFYVAGESGDYNIVCTDGNGCEVEAAIFDVLAKIPLVHETVPLTFYPDPALNELKFDTDRLPSAQFFIEIYNAVGEKFIPAAAKITDGAAAINVRPLVPGIYYITINSGEKSFRSRFIKQ